MLEGCCIAYTVAMARYCIHYYIIIYYIHLIQLVWQGIIYI